MASISMAHKKALYLSLSTVAALLVLGFLWLVLEEQTSGPATNAQRQGLAPAPPGSFTYQQLAPRLAPPPAGTVSDSRGPAAPSRDNFIVLAASGAVALGMAGVAFIFRRKSGMGRFPLGIDKR